MGTCTARPQVPQEGGAYDPLHQAAQGEVQVEPVAAPSPCSSSLREQPWPVLLVTPCPPWAMPSLAPCTEALWEAPAFSAPVLFALFCLLCIRGTCPESGQGLPTGASAFPLFLIVA